MNAKKQTHLILSQPSVMVGNHEPLIFRRRTGSALAYEADRFAYEHSEELVKRLASRGVNWIRTHYFKGFGLRAEREEIEQTRRFVELCHRHGVKVELYTQFGTLQYETFLAEEPGMLDWCAVNEDGKHPSISYGHQNFRYKPCLVKGGYWEYLKKVLRMGVEHVRADAFGFDNVGHPSEPEACHCPSCRAAFVEFLKRKYRVDTPEGRALATERFGFATLDHVGPPTFNRWNPMVMCRVLKDPVMQEWVEFKCDNLARRFEEIWHFVKGLRPEMIIEYNVYGDFGCDNAWYGGSDVHRLFPWVEAFWNERAPDAPEFTDDGRFLHRVHPYKLGDAYDAVVFDWHAGSSAEQRRLSLAEGLAFNRGHLSGFGYMGSFAEASFPELDALLSFRRSHPELYVNTHSIAQVGLFESARSLAYNTVDPHYAEVLALGSLLAGHVPFDLVPELTDEALARHPVLVLAGVECMSDAESQRVLEYVRRGGAAVVTDQTSFFDQWRRRRREPGLFPMLKEAKEFARLEFGRSMATAVSEAQRKKGPTVLKGGFGKGRFAYLPHLQPVKPFVDTPDQWEIGTHYWHLPKNFEAFVDAVRWAGNGKLNVEVTGSTGLAAEARQSADGRIIVHLVNYRLHEASSKVTLTVRGARAATAHVWRPWTLKHEKLPFKPGLEEVSIKVGSVRCYTIVEFK